MSFFHCLLLFTQHCKSVMASKRWLGNFPEKYFHRIKEIRQLLFMLIVSNKIVSLEGKSARQNRNFTGGSTNYSGVSVFKLKGLSFP